MNAAAILNAIPRIVECLAFGVVLLQAVRHRAAHQSVLDAIASAQSDAQRAAEGAAAAAASASQALAVILPHADNLAQAVERLPVTRSKRGSSDTAAADPAPAAEPDK